MESITENELSARSIVTNRQNVAQLAAILFEDYEGSVEALEHCFLGESLELFRQRQLALRKRIVKLISQGIPEPDAIHFAIQEELKWARQHEKGWWRPPEQHDARYLQATLPPEGWKELKSRFKDGSIYEEANKA